MAKPKDAYLTVNLQTPSNLRWSGSLPVEVRDSSNMVLTARGVSDGLLNLPSGRYFVTALLPNGEASTLDEIVELHPGEQKQVKLSVADLDFPKTLESAPSLTDRFLQLVLPVSKYLTSRNVSLIRGDILGAKVDSHQYPLHREPTALSTFSVAYSVTKTWIEIADKDSCMYVAVPVDEGKSTTVHWSLDSSSLALNFDFRDGESNSFLDFIQNDRAFEARSISQSIIAQSEQYMMDKGKSPLRAVLGAYVLLRANELDGMDSWTSNLLHRCTWLPDVLAIRIEYLARNGQHSDAVRLMLQLPDWGTPWFRSGVGYLDNRAKVYSSLAGKRSDVSVNESEQKQLARIAAVARELAGHLDMSQFTTVFRDMARIG